MALSHRVLLSRYQGICLSAGAITMSFRLVAVVSTSHSSVVAFHTRSQSFPQRESLTRVPAFDGEPRGLDSQALRWIAPDQLAGCDLLEADLPMIGPLLRALQ